MNLRYTYIFILLLVCVFLHADNKHIKSSQFNYSFNNTLLTTNNRNDLTLEVSASKTVLCGAETVAFNAVATPDGGVFSWSPIELFPNQNTSSQTVEINQATTVIVTYTLDTASVSDTVEITLAHGTDFAPAFADTVLCRGESVIFGDFTLAPNYSFAELDYLDFTNLNIPKALPLKDITYTVTVNASDGSCAREYIFDIKLAPGNFEIKSDDYVELCLGDSTIVTFTYDPKPGNIIWEPQDSSFNAINDSSFLAKPSVTTTYKGSYTVGGCVFERNVTVRVDSLPSIPVETFWPKEYYCQGEIVAISSPNYISSSFPDIQFSWGQPLGGVQPFDQLNLAVITQDTFLYIRKTTNRACYQEDSILLNVVVPLVEFTLTDTLVCPDAPVPVSIVTDMEDIEWSPEDGVDCISSDCKTVILSTSNTQVFTVSGKSEGCPAGAAITVNINRPLLQLSVHDTIICPNEPVQVSVLTPASGLNWTPTQNLSCIECVTTTITTPTAQTYTVYGFETTSGCPASGSINVNIAPPINFNITIAPSGTIAIGTTVVATITDPVPGASYEWKINGRSLGIQGASYEIVIESESNLIEAILVSGQGGNFCTGSGFNNVAGVRPYLDMPNAFTPNGDQINDHFRAVVPPGVNVVELIIVNRWGQTMYTEKNGNSGWDGRFKGNLVPADTYLYKISYQLAEGGIIEEKRGEVTLLR